jgi:hypothetical protein
MRDRWSSSGLNSNFVVLFAWRTADGSTTHYRNFETESGNRKRRSRWSVLTVFLLDRCTHFLETFAFVLHLHHVTRDAYANVSGQAHSIEHQFVGSRAVLQVARCVARVPL